MFRMTILLSICISISGCTAFKAVIAMNKSTEQFIPLKQDSRVLYEEGSEAFALQISRQLDAAIQAVERGQYSHFKKPVTIHVCNTIVSFTSYCVQRKAAGCVINERLFLSPVSNQKGRNVLTHELSHLHMGQKLEFIHWATIPVWFQEGLAVYVSNDEGAKKVTKAEASHGIATGKIFKPNKSGGLIFRKQAHSFNLAPHMFYKQAGMFISFLHDIDKDKFKSFILAVADGKTFELAFVGAYRQPIDILWNKFVQLHKKNLNKTGIHD